METSAKVNENLQGNLKPNILNRITLWQDNHIITVCNCNSNGATNEVCDKLDGSCICSDGHHGKQCQFGESCKKLCQLQKQEWIWVGIT